MSTSNPDDIIPSGAPRDDSAVGDDDFRLESREEVEAATVALVKRSSRLIRIYTPDLEHAIWDRTPVLDALTLFSVHHRSARLEALVLDSRKAVQPGHRLIEMARKIGSRFEFRRPREMRRPFKGSLILADDEGYLYRPRGDRYRGWASVDDRYRNRQLSTWFDEIWEQADPDPETRQLYL